MLLEYTTIVNTVEKLNQRPSVDKTYLLKNIKQYLRPANITYIEHPNVC